MARKFFKVATDDHLRILLTETLPYEVPLIFSNDGFYEYVRFSDKSKLSEILSDTLGLGQKNNKWKTPFNYKISKDIESVRVLSLIHPTVQLRFSDFFKKYDAYITYLCSKSEFSLRYPQKVTSAVYKQRHRESYDVINQEIDEAFDEEPYLLRDDCVELENKERERKYVANYFSYRKFNVLYKFFESPEFIRLEKKFSRMLTLDVSRCFDTIYTHSISWAVKNREHVKRDRTQNDNDFGTEFDKLIRLANYDETNGIVIGPEFSRVFAEIIFQKIDLNIMERLKVEKNMLHNKDYAIRRYIDDFYVFTKSSDAEDIVKNIVTDELWAFKFRINPAKIHNYLRPFTTERTRNIIELREIMDLKFKTLIESKVNESNNKYLEPVNIYNPINKSTSFIKEIKSCWHSNESMEPGFSNYVLSSMLSIFLKIIKYSKNLPGNSDGNIFANFSIFLLDIAHYCFALKPKVSESYKFCQLIILVSYFIRMKFKNYSDKVNYKINDILTSLLMNELGHKNVCGVEKYNLLITMSSIDRNYLPKQDVLLKIIFGDGASVSYFDIVVALYIYKKDEEYTLLKDKSLEYTMDIFRRELSIYTSSEAAHLFLDLMACPYLEMNDKHLIIKDAISNIRNDYCVKNPPGNSDLLKKCNDIVSAFDGNYIFVDWRGVNILRKLQRKQLRETY